MASSFSGKSGRKASIDAEKMIGDTRTDITQRTVDAAATGINQVKTGTKALTNNYGQALTDLGTYYNDQQGYLDQGLGEYDTIGAQADAGMKLQADALGVNGPEAAAAALDTFRKVNPGYTFQRTEAENSVLRKANQSGMLASGNMMDALARTTQGLADSTYGSWEDRLSPYMTMAGHVADARAGIDTSKANAASAMGTNSAAIHTGLGDKLLQAGEFNSGMTNNYATNLNQNLLDLGSQQTAARVSGMNAGAEAAKNRMNVLMGGVNLAANVGLGVAGLPVAGKAPGQAGGSVGGNFITNLFKGS